MANINDLTEKADLPESQIPNYLRYQELFEIGSARTPAEEAEFTALQTTLAPYLWIAQDANAIRQLLMTLFDNQIHYVGYKYETYFDDPNPDDITTKIVRVSDSAIIATEVTEFDTPTSGDITTTYRFNLFSYSAKITTVFDSPGIDVLETPEEVAF